jgi:cell division transport system permease protein
VFIVWLWIRESVQGLFRNLWWTVMSVFLSILCLTLFSVSYIFGLNANFFAENLSQKIEIRADLKEEVTNYSEISQKLKSLPDVSEVNFVSKEEAYKVVEKEMGGDADILQVLDVNPFPARFVIKMKHPDQVAVVAKQIQDMNVAETIRYGKEYFQEILSATRIIRNIGVVLTVLATVFTIFVVVSTIRFNIVQRRHEIHIKQLIGSGMLTIRIPFIIEAVLITCLSCFLVYWGVTAGYDYFTLHFQKAISYVPLVDSSMIASSLITPMFGMAFAIGVIGSVFSTRKFMRRV